jgi:hypothetical protein
MLHLINIHWRRRKPEDGRPTTGHSTYAERGRYFTAARNKAVRKFNRHYGAHLAIERVEETPDPAGIFH